MNAMRGRECRRLDLIGRWLIVLDGYQPFIREDWRPKV
jgi:hypothetical protein